MNKWVIRCEDLKKFNLLSELGKGGQGRVFKVEKSKLHKKDPINMLISDLIPQQQYYAMKVINKSKLCQSDAVNDRQALIREIKI